MRIDQGSARLVAASLVGASLVLAAAAWLAAGGERSTSAASASAGGCEWTIVTTPNVETYNAFHSVTALSDSDVWAAGASGPSFAGQHTLMAHWDGLSWSTVVSPDAGPDRNDIAGIDAITPNDIWAVGYYNDGMIGGTSRSLALHWDGFSWNIVSTPNPAMYRNELYGVTAISAADVWAVGFTWQAAGVYSTLVMHWTGASWEVVPSPNPAATNYLLAVDAVSPANIWAAGYYLAPGNTYQTLVEHWDGMGWTVIPSPTFTSTQSFLTSVSAVSATDVWAVGYTCTASCFGGFNGQPLVLHWDGTAWNVVPLPPHGGDTGFLRSVVARSSSDVWAAGGYVLSSNNYYALMTHWDGIDWTVVPSPRPQWWSPTVNGLDAPSTGDVWAAGEFHYPGDPVIRTLSERYTCASGTATTTPSTPIPSATATRTPTLAPSSTPAQTSTPPPPSATSQATTATATPGQPLPTPSATACTFTFTDVPVGSPFYPFVRCLACRGIVSGYADGTFRPNNAVTRGQLAKIVSESAGFDDQIPPSQHTFSDVPYGSTFWLWAERLADRDVMSGYACGGPNEPCDDQNRPYFRPGNGATRGQLTKIVSNAANFTDTIPDTQYTFTDVPPSNTFWLFVERLLLNRPDVMSGYPCGGPGEPCDGQNRPYFRPNNPLTRGQTSKIVANTFFPSCSVAGR